jgi:hypothetical protein
VQAQKWDLEHAQMDEEDYANARLLEDLLNERSAQSTSGGVAEMSANDSNPTEPQRQDKPDLHDAVCCLKLLCDRSFFASLDVVCIMRPGNLI